jgi:hypothetical protein
MELLGSGRQQKTLKVLKGLNLSIEALETVDVPQIAEHRSRWNFPKTPKTLIGFVSECGTARGAKIFHSPKTE